MARYRVKARSFINNQIVEPGAIVEFTGRPGSNLEKVEAAAKVAPPAPKDPAPAKDTDKPKEG